MRVLLVEDDLRLGQNTLQLLQYENCKVEWAKDGAEALNIFKSDRSDSFDVLALSSPFSSAVMVKL